jgi:hypothetical protein
MANDALLSELMKRAAIEHAEMVDPRPAPAASGQSGSSVPLMTYLAGLGLDAGTTLYGTGSGRTVERNPIMPKSVGGQAAAFGGELAGMMLLRKLLGKKHPKLIDAAMYGLGGTHGIAGGMNLRELGNAGSQRQSMAPTRNADEPPFPGAVKLPDGSWINPEFIQ